jgi:adenosylmethionine-8-amino-7-oxononanoate aminotransferase
VTGSKSNYLYLADRRIVFDVSSGAAVLYLGHDNKRVIRAITDLINTGMLYLCSSFWGYSLVDELYKELINRTGGQMGRVYLTGSGMSPLNNIPYTPLIFPGSEAIEATVKLARQFFYENDKQTPRVAFITREGSYYSNTIGALRMSGFVARRALYKPFLMDNVHHVSACYAYQQRKDSKSDELFVARKTTELEAKFQELGLETVIGFVYEPIIGAALGYVLSVPGYLKAIRDVCYKHGALFILDEVISSIGRCGILHTW